MEDKRCLVVGGGLVATRKCRELLKCSAIVEVLAPLLSHELLEKHQDGKIKWTKSEYHNKYLNNINFCFACTNNAAINELIAQECKERNILSNIADNSKISDFVVPVCRRRGDITLAVNCDENPGAARFAASHMIENMDGKVVEYIGMTKRLRIKCKALIHDGAVRQEYMKSLFTDEMIEMAVKTPAAAYEIAEKLLKEAAEKVGGCYE